MPLAHNFVRENESLVDKLGWIGTDQSYEGEVYDRDGRSHTKSQGRGRTVEDSDRQNVPGLSKETMCVGVIVDREIMTDR